jgi:hypothetical protein
VIPRPTFSTATKTIIGSLSLMAFACALAQAPQAAVVSPAAPLSQPVSLVSGTCPSVRQGGVISLDWNPVFAPSSAATGLKSFRMIFQHLQEDGVNLNPASRLVLDGGPAGRMTAIGNGYFHIEAHLPSSTHPGTYHLVKAHSSPDLPDDQGEAPMMTVSPVRESFCITVVPALRASSSPSGGN